MAVFRRGQLAFAIKAAPSGLRLATCSLMAARLFQLALAMVFAISAVMYRFAIYNTWSLGQFAPASICSSGCSRNISLKMRVLSLYHLACFNSLAASKLNFPSTNFNSLIRGHSAVRKYLAASV